MYDSKKQDVLKLDFAIVGGGELVWTVGARVHVLKAIVRLSRLSYGPRAGDVRTSCTRL